MRVLLAVGVLMIFPTALIVCEAAYQMRLRHPFHALGLITVAVLTLGALTARGI